MSKCTLHQEATEQGIVAGIYFSLPTNDEPQELWSHTVVQDDFDNDIADKLAVENGYFDMGRNEAHTNVLFNCLQRPETAQPYLLLTFNA